MHDFQVLHALYKLHEQRCRELRQEIKELSFWHFRRLRELRAKKSYHETRASLMLKRATEAAKKLQAT